MLSWGRISAGATNTGDTLALSLELTPCHTPLVGASAGGAKGLVRTPISASHPEVPFDASPPSVVPLRCLAWMVPHPDHVQLM